MGRGQEGKNWAGIGGLKFRGRGSRPHRLPTEIYGAYITGYRAP